MTAYYNEFDPFAAAWLRELIKAGHIAPGEVDERSIEDVQPDDLAGFTQCHFFAGIGVWSYALRLAGWPDDRPVWTGSCPCPPFSVAGKKKPCPECSCPKPLPHAFRAGIFRCTACGHDWLADERHLWPEFYRLIRECRPGVIFGEQVAGSDGLAWGDIVQATLELEGYAVGRTPFPACSIGAPNIRLRLYWVAHSTGCGSGAGFCDSQPAEQRRDVASDSGGIERLGIPIRQGLEGFTGDGCNSYKPGRYRANEAGPTSPASSPCGMAYALRNEEYEKQQESAENERRRGTDSLSGCGLAGTEWPGPVNGIWRDADWLFCRDGRWRPVVATHVALVDGHSPGMVRVRHEGADREQEEVVHEHLYPLRQGTGSETLLQWSSGIPIHAGVPEILQQDVHGGAHEERNVLQPESQQNESSQHSSRGLRNMRSDEGSASSSCGQESAEQCAVKLEDVVPLLSPSLSLAELHGDWRTAEALRTLRQAICEKGAVLGASKPVEKIWASLGEKEKNRLRLGFDASRWQKLVAFPLENNATNRVGRLRGYGNAINASQAAEFIRAYMEIKEQPRR